MSPRRNRRRTDTARGGAPPPQRSAEATESWPDGEWVVRSVAGSAEPKTYRCPGCDHEIPASSAHLVAWPADGGVADRRHWHRACWRARDRRGPRALRSRAAPRY